MSKNRASKLLAKKDDKSSKPLQSSGPEMKTSEIRDLIDFISKTGLNEVNIETKELKLHVKREPDQKILKSTPMMAAPVAAPVASALASAALPAAAGAKEKAPEVAGKKTVEIKSPMIGTFYRSASPDKPFFVNVGDEIKTGQVVCIIEAMKLFNEIESEVSGKIVKVLVDNSSPVEYDQPLFLVEPM